MSSTTQNDICPFSDFIGQADIKKRLKLSIAAVKNGGKASTFLFIAPAGFGKTELAKLAAKELTKGENRERAIINSAEIKNKDALESLLAEYDGKSFVLVLDECHNLPNDVQQLLLPVLNPSKQRYRTIVVKDREFTIDRETQTFMLCTTEPQKLFHAFMKRMNVQSFDDYTLDDMKKIAALYLEKESKNYSICYEKPEETLQMMEEIAKVCRFIPRDAFRLVDEDLNDYMLGMGEKVLNLKVWNEFCTYLNKCKHGLTKDEKKVLLSIYENDGCQLKNIAAETMLPSKAISDVHELYLRKLKLIRIDGMRYITTEGAKVAKSL